MPSPSPSDPAVRLPSRSSDSALSVCVVCFCLLERLVVKSWGLGLE